MYLVMYWCISFEVAQMNEHSSLIWELIFYEFELDNNTGEVTKNSCWAKGEVAFDHSNQVKEFRFDCKNRGDQVISGLPKIINFKVILQAMEENLLSSIRRVSGGIRIS